MAKAIAPDAKHEIIGIRPGEKLHEEMITKTDAINTVEFDDYYVILPSTQMWDIKKFMKESNSSIGTMCKFGFSYESGTNERFLTVEEIQDLISNHISDVQL